MDHLRTACQRWKTLALLQRLGCGHSAYRPGTALYSSLSNRNNLRISVLCWILVFLVAVEFLLLPVNYGVLISTQQLPRVAGLSSDDKAAAEQRDWLVWDSKDAITYFVRDSRDQRMLVTIPRKDARVEIVDYNDIFCVLFGANHTDSRPCPREGKP